MTIGSKGAKTLTIQYTPRGSWPEKPTQFPLLNLQGDNWDDFGYKTLFQATLHLNPTDKVDLGNIRILKISEGDSPGRTEMPTHRFQDLGEDYASLGSDVTYYEKLSKTKSWIRKAVLEGLRDAATNRAIRAVVEDLEGFKSSLLRDPSAEAALNYAGLLLSGQKDAPEDLALRYSAPDGTHVSLNFKGASDIPRRINAIIGYNGVGKTTMMAHIARLASATLLSREEHVTVRKYGKFEGTDHRFPRTLAISYSAFDTFQIPDEGESAITLEDDKSSQFGYFYCGLRRPGPGQRDELKDAEERTEELLETVKDIDEAGRSDLLTETLDLISEEASFRRLNIDSIDTLRDIDQFRSLSSGHQISITILTFLVAKMHFGSIALIDEPEAHLHPPLIAALMKAVSHVLDATSSFALVGTHSPVVIQEIPRDCVHVLRRAGDLREVQATPTETYGENLDKLSHEVFNLDSSDSTYVGRLRWLARNRTSEEIAANFPQGISSHALYLLMQFGMDPDA